MITQVSSSLYHQLITTFDDGLVGKDALETIRRNAFLRFKEQGFPSNKQEDWKYTNLSLVLDKSYTLSACSQASLVLDRAEIPGLDTYRLVVVNGKFRADLSDHIVQKGVYICAIEEAYAQPGFHEHFAQYADKTDDAFVALNTALFQSGLFIHVAKNTALDKSIQVIHVSSSVESQFGQTRNLFILEENTEAEIVESFIAQDSESNSLYNNVSELVLSENAKLQHYYLQTGNTSANYINHTEVYQKRHSLYNQYNCTFPGASFVRNTINVRLDDQNVESHLYGITLTAQDQLVDNHTIVDHLKANCESYEWYKNITQDTSTAVFNGKIFVRTDAQKTNAFQQNNNMLIGEKSVIYTKPQLEIFADDVKCSHGCTIGQFDEDALFYLRARGIGEEKARVLMVHAFAFDVTERFSNEFVRHYVDELIEKGLKIT